ncbi:WXG100 family type VII secretion target [Nocardia sp. NPDC058640]|uniref:WXG100 family type VII secretion target n=1 Tax=Nocardia sp. NPDC058640 TaxID=3346571 RepID=UPI0036560EE4
MPISTLSAPSPNDPIPDLVELIINGNIVSPSYWVNYILNATFGIDILKDTTNKFAGDWQALQTAGAAVGNMSDYIREYSAAISQASRTVDSSWNGNAAESAQDYFKNLSTALTESAVALKDVSATIDEYALSSYYMAQFICGKIQDIYDFAIIWAIKAAASAAMASTGVGAVGSAFTMASGAYEVAQMIASWQKVLGKFTELVFASEAAAAIIVGGAASVSSTSIPQLAGATYDHQGA